MADRHSDYNQRILLGCGIVSLLALFALGALLVLSISREREVTRYPGAALVTSHNNYSGLPSRFRWDETYRTDDSFTDVYNWYSVTFDLGSESRANGRCLLLEGNQAQLLVRRYISVFLCNTATGQVIFVSRTTALK